MILIPLYEVVFKPKEITWYRGTMSADKTQRNGSDTDQEGPGTYLTSDMDNALMYGPHIRSVKFTGKLIPTRKYPMLKYHLIRLVQMHPEPENFTDNYSEDPVKGLKIGIDSVLEYNDSVKDCFLQIWINLYRHKEQLYIDNMAKLGYDGFWVETYNGVKHLIVYNEKKLINI